MKLSTRSTTSLHHTPTTASALPTSGTEASNADFSISPTYFWCVGIAAVIVGLLIWVATRCWLTRHDDPPLYSFRWVRECNIRRKTRRLKPGRLPRAPPPSVEDVALEEGRAGANEGAEVAADADKNSNLNALPFRTDADVDGGTENTDTNANSREKGSSNAVAGAPVLPPESGDERWGRDLIQEHKNRTKHR